jgi:3-oxoacyl-[acyl-carrier protein] reductase
MLARLPESTVDSLRQSIPLGRIATAEDVAASIAFLCSNQASYLTGTVMNVSGGLVLD